jgi:hypothetical protein
MQLKPAHELSRRTSYDEYAVGGQEAVTWIGENFALGLSGVWPVPGSLATRTRRRERISRQRHLGRIDRQLRLSNPFDSWLGQRPSDANTSYRLGGLMSTDSADAFAGHWLTAAKSGTVNQV